MMLFLLVIFMGSMGAGAEEPFMTVPLHAKPTGTYYLEVSFNGAVHNDLMLDTGSEFLVINETTLRSLHHDRRVTYRHDISGVLADGSTVKVPVYHLSSLKIGCCCVVRDMDAAVFPGNTREILGLTVLRKVAPFSVSLDPENKSSHRAVPARNGGGSYKTY